MYFLLNLSQCYYWFNLGWPLELRSCRPHQCYLRTSLVVFSFAFEFTYWTKNDVEFWPCAYVRTSGKCNFSTEFAHPLEVLFKPHLHSKSYRKRKILHIYKKKLFSHGYIFFCRNCFYIENILIDSEIVIMISLRNCQLSINGWHINFFLLTVYYPCKWRHRRTPTEECNISNQYSIHFCIVHFELSTPKNPLLCNTW